MLLWFGVRTLYRHSSSIKVVLPGRDPKAMSLSSSKDFRNYHMIPIEQADGSPIVVGSFRSQRTESLYGPHDVMNGRGLARFPSVAVSQFPMN